jgi:quinol monooxygenase YgiN
MNSEQLQWIVEFEIKRGKREEFEKVIKELSDAVRRSEPGARKYEWFIDQKGKSCVVIEAYNSSEAGIAHVKGQAIKRLFPQLLKLAKVSSFKVCGSPNDMLIKELADVDATLYQFITGFSR